MTIIPLTEEIINNTKIYHDKKPTKLKLLRTAKKWTQQELANRTRISVAMLGHYEQGTRKIPEERKKIIAKVLGCKIKDLE